MFGHDDINSADNLPGFQYASQEMSSLDFGIPIWNWGIGGEG